MGDIITSDPDISNKEQASDQPKTSSKKYSICSRVLVPKPVKVNHPEKETPANFLKMYFSEIGSLTRLAKCSLLSSDCETSKNTKETEASSASNVSQGGGKRSAFNIVGSENINHLMAIYTTRRNLVMVEDQNEEEEEKLVSFIA